MSAELYTVELVRVVGEQTAQELAGELGMMVLRGRAGGTLAGVVGIRLAEQMDGRWVISGMLSDLEQGWARQTLWRWKAARYPQNRKVRRQLRVDFGNGEVQRHARLNRGRR